MNLVGDFDGDGRTEILDISSTGYGNSTVSVNHFTGSAFTTSVYSNLTLTSNSTMNLVADFDGDGKADVMDLDVPFHTVCNMQCHPVSAAYINYSTGDGFNTVNYPVIFSGTAGMNLIGDFDGDGKSELLVVIATGQGNATADINYFTGSTLNVAEYTGLTLNSNPAMNLVGDFNGDGKADILTVWSTGVGNAAVYVNYSTGNGFSTVQYSGLTLNGTPSQNILGDFNGDGLTDLLDITASGQGNASVSVNYSTGHGFITKNYSGLSLVGIIVPGDFNGDGQTDLWGLASTLGRFKDSVYRNESNRSPDLLSSISNGIGGTTAISYTPSSQYTNKQLPFPIQTVSSITFNDGNNVNSTNLYSYSGGFYHIAERDFRGFNYVKVEGPEDPNLEQKIEETWFHQGDDITVETDDDPTGSVGYTKGKPYRKVVSDRNSAVYAVTTYSYASQPAGITPPPYFNPLYQVDAYNCDGQFDTCEGSSSARHVQATYSYDQYGNVTSEYRSGDLNDPSDTSARRIARNYVPNTTAWILALPSKETIYSGQTTTMASTDFSYDYSTGNLTKIVRYFDGTHDPVVQMIYDPVFGNLSTIKDARNNSTTFGYDTATNTFPVSVTNALNQKTSALYYSGTSSDQGLYGQIQNVTDPNGAVTSITYDPFGRKTQISANNIWTKYIYNDNALGTVGSQNIEVASTSGISTWTYFDGFGRPILEKKTGPNGKIDISRSYNPTGTIAENSLPYLDGTTGDLPAVEYTYDPLGRLVAVNNPDGSGMSSCYDNGVMVIIDANQNRKRFTRDTQGNLVKVEEYEGTYDGCLTDQGSPYATTLYTYNVLGSLLTVTDAENNQTIITYDPLSRKTSMQDPDMGHWSYGYDANGNLTSQTDAKMQTITFSYDELNRLGQKIYPDNTSASFTFDVKPDTSTTTTYPIGRLSKMTDASGTSMYFYDNMGRLSTMKKTVDGTTYTIAADYDNGGRLSSLQYPDGAIVGYGYDDGGNLNLVTRGSSYGAWQNDACYNLYDPSGTCPQTRIDNCNFDTTNPYTCPNNIAKTCNDVANDHYDAGSDTEYWNYRTVTCGLPYVSYTNFNAFGQPGNETFGNGVQTAYQYNPSNGRLTSLITGTQYQYVNLSYRYDSNGNIIDIYDQINPRSQSLYYDDLNRLIEVQSAAYEQPVLAYFYDQIGNITYKEGVNYSYIDSTGKRPHAVKSTSTASTAPYYRIFADAGSGGGTITPGTLLVESGANQTFTITPNPGYQISNVYVSGGAAGPVGAYNFTNVTADQTISARFAVNTAYTPPMSVSNFSAGLYHTVNIGTDGTLWAWGGNSNGQLGDGLTDNKSTPARIGNSTNWKSIAAGGNHTLAVRTDGTLWAWGWNPNGELGDNSTTTRYSPVQIGSDMNWKAVAAGLNYSLGLKADGTLWAWGDNYHGELGDNSNTTRYTPVLIGSGWIGVAAGSAHTVAMKSDGSLWAWGYNASGQLGDGTTTDRKIPVQIGTGWLSFAAGASSTIAIKTDGTLWAWGSNPGVGNTTYDQLKPVRIGNDTNWKSIAAGNGSSFAIKTNGTLWAWGSNISGELGDGTTTSRYSPVQIGNDTRWVSVQAGFNYTVALKSDGTLWAWGYNANGQLGNGTTANKTSPVLLKNVISPLIVTKSGTGTGTVTSSPAGITCGTTCSAGFPVDTTVTLTALPGTNSSFSGWTGSCVGSGSCTVPIDAANIVEAVFSLNSSGTNTSGTATASYTYDDNGNMISDGQRTIAYNYDNMPSSVTWNGATTSYVYDGMGNRVKKITSNGTTVYIGGLYQCVEGGSCSEYIFAGDTRIANKISGTTNTFYYHGDHLGSTRVVTGPDGTDSYGQPQSAYCDGWDPQSCWSSSTDTCNSDTSSQFACPSTLSATCNDVYNYQPDPYSSEGGYSWNYRTVTCAGIKNEDIFYYPFGSARSDTGAISASHKYTSQEFETETGLYNYNARLYNPSLGKFLTADSVVPDPANPQSLNRYSYVFNNPIFYTDPTGHDTCVCDDEGCVCSGGGSGGGDGCYNFYDCQSGGGIPGGGTGGGGTGNGGSGGGSPIATTITSVSNSGSSGSFGNYVDSIAAQNFVQYIDQNISIPETGLFQRFRDYILDRGIENIKNGNEFAGAVDWLLGNTLYSIFNPRTLLDVGMMAMPIGYMERPYWRYLGGFPESRMAGNWLTRGWGWERPYNMIDAKEALQLELTPYTAIQADVPWYQPVIGPRPALGNPQYGTGWGAEYYRATWDYVLKNGWRFPTQ